MKPYFVLITTEGAPVSSVIDYWSEDQARDYAEWRWNRLSTKDKPRTKITVGKIAGQDGDAIEYEVLDTLQEVSA